MKGIAEAYVAAGSQIVETNSFGGSSLKLNSYGLRDKAREFNRAAASLAREHLSRPRAPALPSISAPRRSLCNFWT